VSQTTYNSPSFRKDKSVNQHLLEQSEKLLELKAYFQAFEQNYREKSEETRQLMRFIVDKERLSKMQDKLKVKLGEHASQDSFA